MNIRINTYHHSKDIPPLPGSDVFHSTSLFRLLEKASGYKPVLIVARNADENGQPVAKLLCITRRWIQLPFFLKKTYSYGTGEFFNLTSPAASSGNTHELSAQKEQIFGTMLNFLTKKLGRRSFLLEFRNLNEPLFGYRYFRKNGYFPIRWLRVRNSIHHTAIDKWMSASRKRQISRGLKNGATTAVARTREEVENFFHMLKKYYSSKIQHYLPDLNFFISLIEQDAPGEEFGKIFLVRDKEHVIGGSVCLFSNDTCYLIFSAGMRKSYPRLYPGVLAIWAAMTYARQKGFDHFEFIDAGLPFKKYGYRDFILRFGGKQISTRRWFKTRIDWLNKLLIKIYV